MIPLAAILALAVLSSARKMVAAQTLSADSIRADFDVEAFVDGLSEDDEAHSTEILEVIADLLASPLDLNTASAEDLAAIPGVDPILIARIIQFRARFGHFTSISELQAVEGFTEESLRGILPFVHVLPDEGHATPAQRMAREDRYEIIQRIGRRIEVGRGYSGDTTRTTYLGSPYRVYTRLRFRRGRDFQANLTMDKGPGEEFRWNPATGTYGYDFLSGHIMLRNRGVLSSLVFGDFTVEAGQGLILWRSSGFGKGQAVTRGPPRSARGVAAFSSTDASRFFRGAAATLQPADQIAITAFASNRNIDATLAEGSSDDSLVVTSVSLTGQHRTHSELARKSALNERVAGASARFAFGPGTIGMAGYMASYAWPFVRGSQQYRLFHFEGSNIWSASAYGSASLANIRVFGEAGRSSSGAPGAVAGTMAQLSPGTEVLVLIRHYPPDFHSPFGHAFGDRNGLTQNENGIYAGLRVRVSDAWRASAFFDQFSFPWLRFGVPRPTSGHETFVMLEYRPTPLLLVYGQVRQKVTETGAQIVAANSLIRGVTATARRTFRLHADFQLSPVLRIRTRAEFAHFVAWQQPTELGAAFMQDVRWRMTPALQVDLRLATFFTPGFNSRIYAYEMDLPHVFSIPALSGTGQRSYLVARYRPTARLEIALKAAEIRWQGVRTVGSGLDEVEGNRLTDLRGQVLVRL